MSDDDNERDSGRGATREPPTTCRRGVGVRPALIAAYQFNGYVDVLRAAYNLDLSTGFRFRRGCRSMRRSVGTSTTVRRRLADRPYVADRTAVRAQWIPQRAVQGCELPRLLGRGVCWHAQGDRDRRLLQYFQLKQHSAHRRLP